MQGTDEVKPLPPLGELKEQFKIEAVANFVGGLIVVPGHPPMSADAARGEPAYPGILIKWAREHGRRVFDVNAAARNFARDMMAAQRGYRSAEDRGDLERTFVEDLHRWLKDSDAWNRGDIVLWRSQEELDRERTAETIAEISTEDLLGGLQARGLVPEDATPRQIQEGLRKFLRSEAHGQPKKKTEK